MKYCFLLVGLLGYIYATAKIADTVKYNRDSIRIATLKNEMHVISSIDTKVTDYNDLSFFENVIEEADIILLGEHYHDEGSTLSAKNRLIQYFHQRLGFEVLIEEQTLVGNHKAWELIKAGFNVDSVMSYLYSPIYSMYNAQLYCYVQKYANSSKPLEIAGLDVGGVNVNTLSSYWVDDFKEYVIKKRGGKQLIKSKYWKDFYNISKSHYKISSNEELLYYKNNSDSLIAILSRDYSDDREIKFWVQAIKNDYATAYWIFNRGGLLNVIPEEFMAFRDKQMANNLIWLIDEYYKGKKIIISTSTYHILRNVEGFRSSIPGWNNAIPMGEYIWNRYKDRIYSISFVSYQGIRGVQSFHSKKKPENTYISEFQKTDSVALGSIEALFHRTGASYSFINLKNIDNEIQWLTDLNYLSPTFHIPILYHWNTVFDGIFYIDCMEPDIIEYYKTAKFYHGGRCCDKNIR